MLVSYFSPMTIISGGVVAFLFGWAWYSKALFMEAWLDGKRMSLKDMPTRSSMYMWQVMLFTLMVGTAMTGVLAFILDSAGVENLKQALALSIIVSLGFIGLKDFSDMLYTMPDTFWSIRAQKKFFVDAGYYVCMFALVTTVMYYVQVTFGV